MWNKQKYSEIQMFKTQGGVHIFGHIKSGLGMKFECLKVILSW